MATFTAACYDDKGTVTMSETEKLQLMADKDAMTATVKTRDETIATRDKKIKDLETSNIQLEADLKNAKENAKAENDGEKMPTWAIAIIVVIGAVLLLVIAILGVVVSR